MLFIIEVLVGINRHPSAPVWIWKLLSMMGLLTINCWWTRTNNFSTTLFPYRASTFMGQFFQTPLICFSLSLSLCFAKFILHKHTYIYIQRTVICMLFLNISIKADGGLCVDHSFWFMHIRIGSDIAPYKALFSVGV